MKSAVLLFVLAAFAGATLAKLPAPAMTDEAKAKAAEAAAKTAHAGKAEAYLLCQWQDKVAARHFAEAKQAGKATGAPVAMPPCANPGPFVYTPAAPAPAPASAPAPAPTPVAKK